jgi:chemotaxis protein histidine kinase CheA
MTQTEQADTPQTHYEDHSVIVPPHKLKTAILHTSEPGDIAMDPVEKAEEALATLKGEFNGWMQAECDLLESARNALHQGGPEPTTLSMLFRASHDIKGDAATLGYPLAGRLAGSLCRLLDHAPDRTRIPVMLVDRSVEAIRAVVREQVRDAGEPTASEIAEQLAILVEKFLAGEMGDGYAEIAGEAYVQIDFPGKI